MDKSQSEKIPLKDDSKYQNIVPVTNRSNINLLKQLDESNMNMNMYVEKGQMVQPVVENGPSMLQGKPMQLQLRPMILQNPQTQLFNPVSNYSVCPFCKYSGSLEITYINSKSQRNCCIFLALIGLFFLAWIPFMIKDLSIQVLKCSSCKKELKQIGGDN